MQNLITWMHQATFPDHNFYWKMMGMLNTTYFLQNSFDFCNWKCKPSHCFVLSSDDDRFLIIIVLLESTVTTCEVISHLPSIISLNY